MLKRREWLESAMQNHDEYEFLDRQYNFALKAQRSVQQVEANSQDKVNRIRKIESLLEDSEDLCAHENVLEKVGRLYIRTDSDNYISKLKEDLENMTFEHSGVLEQGERLRDKLVHAQSDLNEALAEAPLYSLQRALARQRRLGRGGAGAGAWARPRWWWSTTGPRPSCSAAPPAASSASPWRAAASASTPSQRTACCSWAGEESLALELQTNNHGEGPYKNFVNVRLKL